MVKITGLILLLFAITGNLYAQIGGKITGKVKDATTHETIAYATVSLINLTTKAAIKATQTDSTGNFVLDNLPEGTFIQRISFVGYETFTKDGIVINKPGDILNLGDALLKPAATRALNEVTVTAKKSTLQNKDGKKVFSVDQSLVSLGGTATDLLQNVPTLQIDINGNVSLRGSTGVKVLIDGKPSPIAGGDVIQILQSIPASAIESVEVIPNPSAKYDADGEGIINIVLKKNSKPGLNGSAPLAGGTRDNYNGSGSLSYQTNKINIYGNYSLRNGDRYSNGYQYITFLKPTGATIFSNELFPSTTRNKIQNLKTGIEYSITPKSILSISGSLNLQNTHRNELLNIEDLDINGAPTLLEKQHNTTNNNGKSYELDFDYSQHFKKPKEELTFNFSYSHSNFNNFQVYQTNSFNGQSTLATSNPLKNDILNNGTNYNIQADYVLPTGKTGQLSAGYRSQISLGNNDQYAYNLTAPIYPFTDLFGSNNQIHAFYLNYQQQIKSFSYELGLRREDAHLNATYFGYGANNTLYPASIKVPSKGPLSKYFFNTKIKKRPTTAI